MSRDLYFIRLIAQALRTPDPKGALREAFEEIRAIGQQPDHTAGYQQFLRFIDMVRQDHGQSQRDTEPDDTERSLDNAVADLAEDLIELDRSESSPREDDYNEIRGQILLVMDRPPVRELHIETDGQVLTHCVLDEKAGTQVVTDVRPGHYRMTIETGLVLWDGILEEQDLLWSHAAPRRPLEMAADTDESPTEPSRILDLLDGAIVAHVFPGVESGTIEITRRHSKGER